jgi:hypothetical protein
VPLIQRQLRPNWVRFVILAFGPLAPRTCPVFFDNLASFRSPRVGRPWPAPTGTCQIVAGASRSGDAAAFARGL